MNTSYHQHKKHICRWACIARCLIATLFSMMGMLVLVACDDDDESFPVFPINRPNALVTVKPIAQTDSFYLQLDDSTTLTAVNMRQKPYGDREVRALVNYRFLTQPNGRSHYDVYVNWIDSVLTKRMAADLGKTQNALSYGTDPVEILRDWTVVEDGYLTIHFRTQWAANGAPHYVNLVATDTQNPYDITFYHNAAGTKGGYWGDGIVAFDLRQLPDTDGKFVDMTLRWTSFSGNRSVVFRYCSRHNSIKIEGLSFAASGHFERAIK